jgi:hypothetical protein
MIEYILGVVTVLAVLFVTTCYLKPLRTLHHWEKVFTENGYSVFRKPYSPFKVSFINEPKDGEKNHGDAFYLDKTELPKYDVYLTNKSKDIIVNLINPGLLTEFFTAKREPNYPKTTWAIQCLQYFFGTGLVFSEGSSWVRKNTILTKYFGYDLVKANISNISDIVDRCLDEYEK